MVDGLCSKRANRPKYSKFTKISGVEDHGRWSMLQESKQPKYSKFTKISGVEDHGQWPMLQESKQAKVQ